MDLEKRKAHAKAKADLLLREEELHPDLRRYVCASRWEPGTFELHHPLVRTFHLDPQRAAIENRKYEPATAAVLGPRDIRQRCAVGACHGQGAHRPR